VGGFARETSIKVSPHGTLFECCTRSSGQVQRSLRAIGPLGTWVASGGETCRGSLHHGVSLWNIVSVLYEVFRAGSTKSSSYRSIRYVSCSGGETCRGSLHHGVSLWNIVSVLYEVFRPGSTKSSSYWSIRYVSCKWGGLQGKPPSRFLLMEHCFSVVRGLQARFNEVFKLSVH